MVWLKIFGVPSPEVAQVMDEEGFHEVPVPVSPESYGGFRVKATKKL